MSKSITDMILDTIFDSDWVGRRGEKLTERELKWVSLFGRKGKTLRNVYLPAKDGETSEIDVMYITQKGIFVFESKNYSGWIFGDENSMYWTCMLPNKQKNRFYNPIKQNRTHLKWLAKYVGEEVPLFSLVVFSERCELKKVSVESADVKVIKRDRLYAAVRSIWDQTEDRLSDEQIQTIYEELKALTNVDKAVKAEHIESIERRFKHKKSEEVTVSDPVMDQDNHASDQAGTEQKAQELSEEENESAAENPETAMLCPRCGSPLVLRTAKKGPNAGNQFYGCSRFPKCRYMKAVDEAGEMGT